MSIELIKINTLKNSEFEFLIFKTKRKLLQNLNDTTHWNFPWYHIRLLSLIPDTSAARSEYQSEFIVVQGGMNSQWTTTFMSQNTENINFWLDLSTLIFFTRSGELWQYYIDDIRSSDLYETHGSSTVMIFEMKVFLSA